MKIDKLKGKVLKANKILMTSILLVMTGGVQAAVPSNEEIFQMIQELRREIVELKAENNKLRGTVEEVTVATDEAIKAQIKLSNKSIIGGYGELHGNWLNDQKGSSDTDKIDFHRFVLFYGHEFTDKLRFFSELELEHSVSGESKTGEIELEQAYLEYDISDKTSLTAGLFLIPVGILNETHEPATLYGVERNKVETNIVPTTWWEGGAMMTTQIADGLDLNFAVTSGLKSTSNYKPRDGRQKVGNATAKKLAYTTRVKYTAVPGFELAGTINYQDDYSQDSLADVGSAILYEMHAVIKRDDFSLRALYAEWDIRGSGPEGVGRDEQFGFYVEPSYKFTMLGEHLGIFGRYSLWDNNAGSGSTSDTEYQQYDIGVNWWIHKDVVFKVDYQDQLVGAGITKELDGINVGLGYAF